MKISRIVLYNVDVPIKYLFTTGFGSITSRPTIIVKIQTEDGITSWGEAPPLLIPLYKPEGIGTCLVAIKEYLAPLVLGQEFATVEEFVQLYSGIKGNLFAKTGLETAVWLALALQTKTSVTKLLGATRRKIATGISVGIGTLEETFAKIDAGLAKGTKRVKLKIKPDWDIQLVKKVREKYGDITLMVDGNSAYTLDHLEALKQLDDFSLLMIEQPLADDDIIDHSILQKTLKTPICLDESIANAEDARKAIYLGACRIINIKPGRVGGLLESRKIHEVCQQHKVGVWCGGMFESGIGRGFNLAVSALDNFVYPADMNESLDFFTDNLVTNPHQVEDGYIKVPQGIGTGFTVDSEKVEHYAKEIIVC